MRVTSKLKLSEFWVQHPTAKAGLQDWYEEASRARWESPQDIKRRYAAASFLPSNRAVFNIKGNDFRLVVAVAYRFQAVYIKFVGTHGQYDAIDAATVEPTCMTQSAYPLSPIRTEADYQAALALVEPYFGNEPEPESEAGAHFEALITLIQAYEAKHFPIDPPDPIEAIKFRMEQAGLTVKDLEPMIGRTNRVYEVLNHKRPLTLPMIWRLHRSLGIPAEVLIQPPPKSPMAAYGRPSPEPDAAS